MVGYHDSFWVVVGGAAPVIALAAVLAAKDTGAQLWQWRQSTFVDLVRGKRAMSSPPRPMENRFIGLIWVGLHLFFVNIVVQAVALGFSLLSLAYGKNEISPTFGVIAGIGGLTILALATFSSHRASMIEMLDRSTGSLPLEEMKRFAAEFYG